MKPSESSCLRRLISITRKTRCHGLFDTVEYYYKQKQISWTSCCVGSSSISRFRIKHAARLHEVSMTAEIHHRKTSFEICLFGWGLLGPNKNDSSTQTNKNAKKVLRAPWDIKCNKTKQRYANLVQRANQTVCCGCG